MQARFGVDRAQAQRVGAMQRSFIQRLNPAATMRWRTGCAGRPSLHEVGFAISHSDYHKHAAYLIQHSDMPGFRRRIRSGSRAGTGAAR